MQLGSAWILWPNCSLRCQQRSPVTAKQIKLCPSAARLQNCSEKHSAPENYLNFMQSRDSCLIGLSNQRGLCGEEPPRRQEVSHSCESKMSRRTQKYPRTKGWVKESLHHIYYFCWKLILSRKEMFSFLPERTEKWGNKQSLQSKWIRCTCMSSFPKRRLSAVIWDSLCDDKHNEKLSLVHRFQQLSDTDPTYNDYVLWTFSYLSVRKKLKLGFWLWKAGPDESRLPLMKRTLSISTPCIWLLNCVFVSFLERWVEVSFPSQCLHLHIGGQRAAGHPGTSGEDQLHLPLNPSMTWC